MLEIDQIAICNREAAKSLERSSFSFEGSQIQSIPFHDSYLASHFGEIPRRWLETITFPMRWYPETNSLYATEKWAKIASKRTFPQLRPLEFAVSSRGGFLLSVSSSQHIFYIHALWWPRSVYAFSGLARQEQELVWKGPDVRNLEGRESWKDIYGGWAFPMFAFGEVKNPWFFPLANGIVAELLPENSHHRLSPLKSSPQMRALLKIASNEFEMRFLVLGGLVQGSWNYQIWGGDFVEFPINSALFGLASYGDLCWAGGWSSHLGKEVSGVRVIFNEVSLQFACSSCHPHHTRRFAKSFDWGIPKVHVLFVPNQAINKSIN